MGAKDPRGNEGDIARRLRKLRIAYDYLDAARFAEHLGVTPTRLNNVENGSPLSIALAQAIVRKIPGVSLDWLYYGIEDGVSGMVLRKLASVKDRPDGKLNRTRS